MKIHIYFIVSSFLLIFTGCKVKSLKNDSNYYDRFNIVIDEYYRKNKDDFNRYNLFYLDYNEILKQDYYFYKILPMREKSYAYSIDINPKHSNLPSDYIEFKGKIFFVQDKNIKTIKPGLLEYLDTMQLLDSTNIKLQLGLENLENMDITPTLTDDSLEGVSYIICKKEPSRIRKVIRSSFYIAPDDKRFENLCE